MKRLLLLVIGALAVVSLAACGDDSGSNASDSGSSSAPATSSTSTTTTAKPTTTTTTEPTTSSTTSTTVPDLSNGAPTAEDAAKGLYSAWSAGNETAAHLFAFQAVITELFARPGGGASWTFQMCEGVAGGAYCTFSYEGGGTQMHVVAMGNYGQGLTGFKVDDIQFTAD